MDGIFSTLKASLYTNDLRENKWVNFELHGPQLQDSSGEFCDPRSAELNIQLSNDEVIFRVGRGKYSHHNKHYINKASMDDGNAVEMLTERSIKTLIGSYFIAKEKQKK